MEDHNLLHTAIDVFSGQSIPRNVGKWSEVKAGTFVTAYFQKPFTC